MISPLAYVDPEAKIGKNVTIEPFAYIEKDVEIGDDCVIMAYASVLKVHVWVKVIRYTTMQCLVQNLRTSTTREKKPI